MTEPEEEDEELEADYGATAEESSLYSEYENEMEIFDDDWSTAPSEAQAQTSTEFNRRAEAYIAHRIRPDQDEHWMNGRELTEAARRRWSDSVSEANEEARIRARDTEDRWSTNSVSGGDRGYVRYDYPMSTPTAVSEYLDVRMPSPQLPLDVALSVRDDLLPQV